MLFSFPHTWYYILTYIGCFVDRWALFKIARRYRLKNPVRYEFRSLLHFELRGLLKQTSRKPVLWILGSWLVVFTNHTWFVKRGVHFSSCAHSFFCDHLWQYPCIFKQKPSTNNAIFLLVLFMLSSRTCSECSLLLLPMLFCSTLYSWYLSRLSFFF